jgi:hypothetical protein
MRNHSPPTTSKVTMANCYPTTSIDDGTSGGHTTAGTDAKDGNATT